jgi:hypothetical protein
MSALSIGFLLLVLAAQTPCAGSARPVPAVQAAPAGAGLTEIKRIYVEPLTGGETAEQLRDMIINAIQESKLYVVTENKERADAILRGAAEDLVFTDKFNSSDNLNARGGLTLRSGSTSARTSSGHSVNMGIGEDESAHIEERQHEAMAAVRLVNKDGDVIWSTTQESRGGMFRGASADVASKVVAQLQADYRRAGSPKYAPSSTPKP